MVQVSKNSLIFIISILSLVIFYLNSDRYFTNPIKEIYKTDYPNYYFAGKRWLEGIRVYTSIKNDVEQELGWKDYIAYTADTPLTVILLSPLSKLSIRNGAWLLNLTSIFLVSASVYLFAVSLNFPVINRLFYICLALSSLSFQFLLHKCHMEAFVFFFISAGFYALKNSKLRTAGILWGLASALKVFPVILLLPYFFNRHKKPVFYSGIISFTALSLISFAAVGKTDALAFVNEIIPKSREWIGAVGNYSIISFFTALLGYDTGKFFAYISATLLFIAYLLFIFKSNDNDQKNYSLSISTALLLSPLAWLNYFILIIPVLIFLTARYSYHRLAGYLPLLFIFFIFWGWPDYIPAPWYTLSLILSFMPMFGLFSIIFYYQKKL